MANMHPWRGKFRVEYQIVSEGTNKTKWKVRTIESEAHIVLRVAKDIEAAIVRRIPHGDEVEH